MTLYASFDATAPQPAPVTGWYDTDFAPYPNLPPSSELLMVSADEWAARLANPSGWAVSGGALVAYMPPPPRPPAPTLIQQAAMASIAGLTITLSGSITLAATLFPTDPVTQGKLGAVVTTISATGAFPGGVTSYPMKDASGTWHTFTVAQYKGVAGAIGAYVAALDLIADGNPLGASALPAPSASLAV